MYTGILYGHKKSYCYIVDSQEDNAKQKQPEPKECVLYDSIPMICETRQKSSGVTKVRIVVQVTQLNLNFRLANTSYKILF